jgi:hypothetical protein
MPTITEIAKQFFDACEGGKGWEECQQYCMPDATFSTQTEHMARVPTLREYTNMCINFLKLCPDARFIVKSFATDDERKNVCAFAVGIATHTGAVGPRQPTGKNTRTDYVYIMDFEGDKIKHMTKVWNENWAMKELGWPPSLFH